MTNFAEKVSAAAAEDPEHPAVKLDDIVMSYAMLDAATARAAGFLRDKGVREGDRVGMQPPKGATLMHKNLTSGAEVARDMVDADPDSVALATLPLFHVFGMNSLMNVTIQARGLMTLVPRFSPEKVLEVIERDRATVFGGVPTMYAALLHHPDRERYDVSSLHLCVSGGSPMPVEVLRGFDEAFGTKVLEG